MNADEPGHQQIIIIKRSSEEEEGHHGGAWKIAFADFMTAMMALFLVLWLINAANEETKRAVASYFNPVRLVERNRSAKGIDEQKSGLVESSGKVASPPRVESKEAHPPAAAADSVQAETPVENQTDSTEARFFANPYEAIDALEKSGIAAAGQLPEPAPGQLKPNEFTDPFRPELPGQNQALKTGADGGSADGGQTKPDKDKPVSGDQDLAGMIEEDIKQQMSGKNAPSGFAERLVKVSKTEEGVKISLVDTDAQSMFEVGSAVPTVSTVFAINAVAKSLLKRSGEIRIFGHTDTRQFRSAENGNWRLSTERANAAYFILRHAGLPDPRVVEIAGFADRRLVVTENPLSGENRRIEILLDSK